MTSPVVWQLDGRLLDVLTGLGAHVERVQAGAYVVQLHGTRRPSTLVWLIAGEQAVGVEAFVLHVIDCPDPAPLHRFLLARNLRLRGVHFAVDDVGDVFLTGSLPHSAVDAPGVDRVLGEVLQLLEDGADALVQLAYGDRLAADPALAAKVLADGAGRRPPGRPNGRPTATCAASPARTPGSPPGRLAAWRPSCCSVTARASGTRRTCSPAGWT